MADKTVTVVDSLNSRLRPGEERLKVENYRCYKTHRPALAIGNEVSLISYEDAVSPRDLNQGRESGDAIQ